MKPRLLDVNVLIALAWSSHVHHRGAQRWFGRRRKAGFRTCPLTQMGFVRLSCNPHFTPDAVAPGAALALMAQIASLPDHEFWPDDLPIKEALAEAQPILGHRQITDAYLIALAVAHGGVLATLDPGVLALPNSGDGIVELLSDC